MMTEEIRKKAEELGKLLKDSDEVKAANAAKAVYDNDEAVQQAAFLVMQQMYAAYYAPQDICVQDSRLLALHQALTAKSYGKYLAAAENLT